MKKVFFGKGGVAVKVTSISKKRYRVEILIPKKSLEKEIQVENSQFKLQMKITKLVKDEIIIRLEKAYNLDSNGNIVGIKNASKLKFCGDGYNGKITLYPKAYVPKNIRRITKSSKISLIKRLISPK